MKVKVSCTEEEKKLFVGLMASNNICPFGYEDKEGKDCLKSANCEACLNNRIKWETTCK